MKKHNLVSICILKYFNLYHQRLFVAEFPHMAAVGWRNLDGNYDFDCGGSLISERFNNLII